MAKMLDFTFVRNNYPGTTGDSPCAAVASGKIHFQDGKATVSVEEGSEEAKAMLEFIEQGKSPLGSDYILASAGAEVEPSLQTLEKGSTGSIPHGTETPPRDPKAPVTPNSGVPTGVPEGQDPREHGWKTSRQATAIAKCPRKTLAEAVKDGKVAAMSYTVPEDEAKHAGETIELYKEDDLRRLRESLEED